MSIININLNWFNLFKVTLKNPETGEIIDIYRLRIGFRTIYWDKTSFLINNQPFYFRGFGRHEDFNVSQKFDYNVNVNTKMPMPY